MKAKSGIISVALLVALCAPSLCGAQGGHPNTRQGWLVGFAVGGGSAALSKDGDTTDREAGGAGFFRAGYAFRPECSVELNSNSWTKDVDGATWTLSLATAAINYYPGTSGLVLRAGIGAGTADATAKFGSVTVSESTSGFGFTAGAAYEFRVARTFALGPQVDFGWATTDKFDFNQINAGLGFTWYFIPKG
jgi:outer membrane protein with beta-barrel domain